MDWEHCSLRYRIDMAMVDHGETFDDVIGCTLDAAALEANIITERDTIPDFEIRTASRVYYPVRDEQFLWIESRAN